MERKQVKYIYGDGTEVTKTRLFADKGKVLTNDGGETYWGCIDVDSTDGWIEIVDPTPIEDDTEATAEDYENALKEVGIIEEK